MGEIFNFNLKCAGHYFPFEDAIIELAEIQSRILK